MLIRLLRLVPGYVMFEATDGFPERFLNLCTLKGVTLWGVKNDGVKLVAFTSVEGYKNIRSCAKKSGMKIRLVKKCGIPFFVRNNKVRAGILAGLVITASFLCFASCVIWDIEVSGNSEIKTEVLLDELSKRGVKIGSFKKSIDTTVVEDELLKAYPELSWASINIFGSKAALEVIEKTNKPEVINENIPSNVVAKKDGQITLVEGYKGTNVVKEGDVVLKGDLLISGVVKYGESEERLVNSRGRVFADTVTMISGEASMERTVEILENTTSKFYLHFLGVDIPLFLKCKGDLLYRGNRGLEANETVLPFGVGWSNVYSFSEQEISFSTEEAEILAFFKCINSKRELFSLETEINSISGSVSKNSDKVRLNLRVYATEDIAEQKKILIE